MRYLLILIPLALAGCYQFPTAAQTKAWDSSACTSYGFRPGTDGYANCMMRRDIARRQMMVRALSSR